MTRRAAAGLLSIVLSFVAVLTVLLAPMAAPVERGRTTYNYDPAAHNAGTRFDRAARSPDALTVNPARSPPDWNPTPHRVALVVAAETEGLGAGAVDPVPDPEPVYRPSGAPNRDSPWYVSYRDAEGNIQTVGNEGGVHAEVRIQQMQPGTPMSRPFGWRTVEGSVGPQWVPGTVCAGCQSIPQTLFPPNIEGAPGGPWGFPWPE